MGRLTRKDGMALDLRWSLVLWSALMCGSVLLAGCNQQGRTLQGRAETATAPPGQEAAQQPEQPLDFPTKPIEIIVPFNPGGGYDAVARQLAVPMQRELGQPVVVKNVPGGGTRIGARQFQSSPPDGHTVYYGTEDFLFAELLISESEGVDVASWVWVANVRRLPGAVYVARNSPFRTVQDIVNADRGGQRIRMAHNGLGGGYLAQQVIVANALGLRNAVYVGGYTGTADIVPALIRGDVDVEVISPVSSVLQFIQSGDIRPLVQLEPTRNSLIPDAPTAREAGLSNADDLEILGTLSTGIAAVPRTPPAVVAVLERAVLNSLTDPDFLAWAREGGVEPDLRPLGAAEYAGLKEQEFNLLRRFTEQFRAASAE